jgi:dihydrofolate reductase
MISLIAAHDRDRVMGVNNDLPWSLPSDLKHFQRMTRGQAVIMGRNTWLSLPDAYRPLPGRDNYIVSRTMGEREKRQGSKNRLGYVCGSLGEAIDAACGDAWIIGGAQLYRSALLMNMVDRMVITEIDHAFDGDVFFPEFDRTIFIETERLAVRDDNFPYEIVTYVKQKPL